MKTKILYVITADDVGGAQKYVHDLADHLDRKIFEAKVLYGGHDLSIYSGQVLRWLSNRTRPWLLFLNDWLALFELVRVYAREKPDVIHLNSSKAGVIGSLAAGIYKLFLRLNPKPYTLYPRVIFTAHGWVFNPTNYLSAPIRWFYIILHKIAALFQDVIINVSEFDRALALRYKIAPARKLVTIHNGIDPNIPFLPKEKARKEILDRLHTLYPVPHTLDPRFPWIGSLGRLTKEKDYANLIAAAVEVPNAYFFIIGSGPELKQLQVISHKLSVSNRFFLVPPSGDDAKLLKAFDVFVLSSIKEGLPYSVLEAMSARIPVIATRVGGVPEIITHEKNGLLISPRNTEELRQALLSYFSNTKLRETLGNAGALTVQSQFPLDQMRARTEKVYVDRSLKKQIANS